MVFLTFLVIIIATYAFAFGVMYIAIYFIEKLPENTQPPIFIVTAILLLTPIFTAMVVIIFPVPLSSFIFIAPFIGDVAELKRMVGVLAPLNIAMPFLTGLIAYKVWSKILSNNKINGGRTKSDALVV